MTHLSSVTPGVVSSIANRAGMVWRVPVTTATSTTVFAASDLINLTDGNNDLVGWWIYVVWDAGGASAAPEGEYRQITDYVDSTGTVTHNAFSAQLALTDVVLIIPPFLYESTASRGGATTLQAINTEQRAGLDFARVQTIASPTTLSAAVQAIYSNTNGRPFFFGGGTISWDSGAWAGGESVTVNVDTKTDGSNWENLWTITLVAAAAPLTLGVPSDANSALLNVPQGFWNDGSGVRVTAQQTVEGADFGVISHSFVDGVPRS